MLLAKQASTEESKQTFLSLSKSWTRLACELEDAEIFLKAISEIEVGPQEGSEPGAATAAAFAKKKPRRVRHRG